MVNGNSISKDRMRLSLVNIGRTAEEVFGLNENVDRRRFGNYLSTLKKTDGEMDLLEFFKYLKSLNLHLNENNRVLLFLTETQTSDVNATRLANELKSGGNIKITVISMTPENEDYLSSIATNQDHVIMVPMRISSGRTTVNLHKVYPVVTSLINQGKRDLTLSLLINFPIHNDYIERDPSLWGCSPKIMTYLQSCS